MRIQYKKQGFPIKKAQLKSLNFFLMSYVQLKNSKNNFNFTVEIASKKGEISEAFNKYHENIDCQNVCEC